MTELRETDRPGPPDEAGEITVAGCPIRYAVPRPEGDDTLLLVHGLAAHSGWWDAVVPQLDGQRVVTLDMSGHGDSGRRARYEPATWGDEVAAVAAHASRGRTVCVGHSTGGRTAFVAAARHPGLFAGLIAVDTPVVAAADSDDAPIGRLRRGGRVYPTWEDARRAFRLVPPQPPPPDELESRVAESAIHEVEGGWSFKVDPSTFGRFTHATILAALTQLVDPLAMVRGDASELTPADSADIAATIVGRPVPMYEIPGAHHHVPLDAPVALAACIEEIVAPWLGATAR